MFDSMAEASPDGSALERELAVALDRWVGQFGDRPAGWTLSFDLEPPAPGTGARFTHARVPGRRHAARGRVRPGGDVTRANVEAGKTGTSTAADPAATDPAADPCRTDLAADQTGDPGGTDPAADPAVDPAAEPGPTAAEPRATGDEPTGEGPCLEAHRRHLDAGVAALDRAVSAEWESRRQAAVRAVALAEFATARPAARFDRAPGERGAASPASRAAQPASLRSVSEWAADEVALALRVTTTKARAMLDDAVTLVHRLPATLDLLGIGVLSEGHAQKMIAHVGPVRDDALRAEIEEHVLGLIGTKTPAELAQAARRVVLRKDAEAQARRIVNAVRERSVRFYEGEDGMSTVAAVLPTPVAAGLYRVLEAYADACRADGDQRTKQQRMADCLVDLVVRRGADGRSPITVALTLVASLETMLGGDEPGEIDGKLVHAEVVREFARAFGLMPWPAPHPEPDLHPQGTTAPARPAETEPLPPTTSAIGSVAAREAEWNAAAAREAEWNAAAAREAEWNATEVHDWEENAEAHEADPAFEEAEPGAPQPRTTPPGAPRPETAPSGTNRPGTTQPQAAPPGTPPTDTPPPGTPPPDTMAAWLARGVAWHARAIDEGLESAEQAVRNGVWTDGDLRAVLDLAALMDRRHLVGTALAHRPHIAVVDRLRGTLVALTDTAAIRRGEALGPPAGDEGYEPGAALDRFVRFRDRRCRFPGCRARPRLCDLDHRIPWPAGPTDHCNLCALCEHHHRLKHQAPGWSFTEGADGALVVRPPSGESFISRPPRFGADDDSPPSDSGAPGADLPPF